MDDETPDRRLESAPNGFGPEGDELFCGGGAEKPGDTVLWDRNFFFIVGAF